MNALNLEIYTMLPKTEVNEKSLIPSYACKLLIERSIIRNCQPVANI
jgi:hypothetical protein